jgi:hypothetical protein
VQAAAIVWEVLLGAWLVWGAQRFAAWLAAISTFVIFAGVSGYLGFIGQANCGCFGLIEASPWAAFAVDVTALGFLSFARPTWDGWRAQRPLLLWGGSLAAIVLSVIGGVLLLFGSVDTALARLRGEVLGTTPALLDFGAAPTGTTVEQTLTVRNYSPGAVRLIGGTSDCSCLATQDLPVTIAAGDQVEIRVKLRVPQSETGQLTRTIELLSDNPKQPRLRLVAVCRIVE